MKHPGGFNPSPGSRDFHCRASSDQCVRGTGCACKSLPAASKVQQKSPSADGPRSEARYNTQRTVSLSFKQLGAWGPISLRGVDTSRTLAFALRADETVVAASYVLPSTTRPHSLRTSVTCASLSMNAWWTWALAKRPRAKAMPGKWQSTPGFSAHLTRCGFMEFSITRQCEDPFHSKLWITINDTSSLELTIAATPRTSDKHLPAPFVDRADLGLTSLPVCV